jgi:hypothetical protein
LCERIDWLTAVTCATEMALTSVETIFSASGIRTISEIGKVVPPLAALETRAAVDFFAVEEAFAARTGADFLTA